MITKSPIASGIPFDPTGTDLVSDQVNAAIVELHSQVNATSKGFVFCSYNGNANSGRYLEFFSGIDSSVAPLYSASALAVNQIVAATTAASATCTIGFYNGVTLLHTLTFTAQKQVISSGAPLFTMSAGGSLSLKVDSGSITKPYLYFIARGA